MNPLLVQFIVEAREQIAATTDGLLALERQTGDSDLLNGIFRSVHTLKGSSGLFDFPALTSVLHAGEDLLVALRERRLMLDPAMLDQILAALDLVSGWLDAIEDGGDLPGDATERGAPAAAALRAWLAGPAPSAPSAHSSAPGGTVIPLPRPAAPAWLGAAPEAALLDAVEHAVVGGTPVVAVAYRPDAQCFFRGDDPLALVRQIPDSLYVGLDEPAPWPELGEYDPFSCLLGFRMISGAPKKEVQHLLRFVAEHADVAEVEAGDLLCFAGAPTGDFLVRGFAADALGQLRSGRREAVGESAAAMLERVEGGSGDAPALRWLARLAAADAADAVAMPVLESLLTALAEGVPPVAPAIPDTGRAARAASALSAPVARLVREQRELLRTPCDRVELAGRIGSAAKVAGNALRHDGRMGEAEDIVNAGWEAMEAADPAALIAVIERTLGEAPDTAAPGMAAASAGHARKSDGTPKSSGTPTAAATGEDVHERASTVLRVDQARIDALMNLIGELVVAKNGLPFLARRAENVYGSREMAREVKEQYAVIDRIALDLRNAIMQVRMLPVSSVFQRFPRLVRDLSRKLGKQVELIIEGEDTQADKTVIESLFEPLLHLVRNALDHGIEADRAAGGKPPTAQLTLAATQDNDQVVIRVADDGRGIDPAVMRRKAVEKGLIDEEQAGRMGDDEAVRLIFAAGFSTAAAVTDVSGRGVGMDAVRMAVEKAGGRIDIASAVGAGTTISLHLPLSMAVTRVMTVSVSGRPFGIPMDEISETVRIPRGDIVAIKDREAFVLRNRIIPLFHLDRLLELPARKDGDDVAVLVVQVDNQTVGLAIDAFGEGMEVIVKPLEGLLENTREYLGTALLGDGRVLLVLDLKEVVQ